MLGRLAVSSQVLSWWLIPPFSGCQRWSSILAQDSWEDLSLPTESGGPRLYFFSWTPKADNT